MENTEKKVKVDGAKALIILLASAAVILLGALVIKSPTVVNLIIAGLVASVLGMIWGVKWDDIQSEIVEFAKRMFPAILILIFVGMLVGSWISSGAVPMIIYYGLKILSPKFFLVVACIACSLMSVLTGTSWGTVGTLGIAFMGISTGLGVPLSYTAGAVLVGALFGDKLSPLSDTTVLAPALSGCDVMEHIKYMLYTTIPSYVISLIFFLVVGLRFGDGTVSSADYDLILSTLESTFNFNICLLIPPVVVLVMIFMRKPILPSFAVGIALGVVCAIIFQGTGLQGALTALNKGFTASTDVAIVDTMICRGGISSMLSSVAVIIAAATFGAPLMACGVIGWAEEKISKFATGQKSLLFCSYAFHMLLILIIGGYYTTFSIAGPMLEPMYEKYGLHKANLSRCLEDSGTTFSPLVPWCSNGVYFTSTLGVPYAAYALTTPFCWLCLVFAFIYIATGFKIKQAEPKEEAAA
ncbi:MAG: Na+/H+ antiporter NhaC [Clostridia bacterium]|nr:Na+/H+ antiporter NhaC [Clostridia bacterium]